MKLGMEVGLGPGHIVLDGDPAPPPPKGHSPPIFGPYLLRPNDCMDQRLLEKLRKHGIGGKLLRTIGNWISKRRQRVCVKGVKSTWEEVWSGVPQGSVLWPLLFLIYINDLEEEVVSKVFKFADDTRLFRQVNDTVDALGIQEDLDRLVQWADKWQMQFNVSKCKVMHVGKKNPRHHFT